jgi:hypothetical protein
LFFLLFFMSPDLRKSQLRGGITARLGTQVNGFSGGFCVDGLIVIPCRS